MLHLLLVGVTDLLSVDIKYNMYKNGLRRVLHT